MMTHKTSNNGGKKKIQVSMIIRDEQETVHRGGVNTLMMDTAHHRLYSGGRDGIIQVWDMHNMNKLYLMSMEHHTDWINDIVVCCNGRHLISASSDTTVKLWNAQKGFCMSTLRTHKDYVKALAYAKETEKIASAGLDRAIFLWDIQTLTLLTANNNTVTTTSLAGNNHSVYSLAMNPLGTVIISGSTEKALRVWDPRNCTKLMKLKGHTDNVKALAVNRDGTQCLSGSSDGSIKLWSLSQQRCIQTIRVHDEGVWTIVANDSFTHVISGGRDRKVFMTDLRNPERRVLICEESDPVLKIILSADQNSIWVSTAGCDIKNWAIPSRDSMSEYCVSNSEEVKPYSEKPDNIIKGGPPIRTFHVLNDKRHILTKDTDNNVCLYDVLKARKVEELGQVDFEKEIKKRYKMVYVPNWFSVDLKIGVPMIHLGQDENDCFSAWVSSKEAGLVPNEEQKVNYGNMLLQALLEHWWKSLSAEDDTDCHGDQPGTHHENEYFPLPGHTPVILSEVGGRTLYRTLVRDTGGEPEGRLLNDNVPQWVIDIVVERTLPSFIKVPFYLLPHTSSFAKTLKKDRLIANDFIQMRKVAEHVVEKVCGSGSESGSVAGGPAGNSGADARAAEENHDSGSLAEEKVELYCNDEVLDPNLDLRTVRHFIWKSSSDLVLHYRIIK